MANKYQSMDHTVTTLSCVNTLNLCKQSNKSHFMETLLATNNGVDLNLIQLSIF